jgi:predicted phosphodiesterase
VRVAALYDVHGNLPALEAVLADVEPEGVDTIVFGGDIASGPFPRQTVDLVRSLDAVCILGNADVLSSPSRNAEWDAARRWVEAQLNDGAIEWLAGLPFSWSADDTLYVHANPVDVENIVTQWTPEERVAGYLEGVAEHRVVSGHVHMHFQRRIGDVTWVCAGSVGMPYADGPGAYWTILEADGGRFMRTEYDLERAAAAIRDSGYPLGEALAAENVLVVPSVEDVRTAWGSA